MTDSSHPEPSMDEILASIRRIISEDDGPAPSISSAHDEEALLLTDRLPPENDHEPNLAPDDLVEHYSSAPPRPAAASPVEDADEPPVRWNEHDSERPSRASESIYAAPELDEPHERPHQRPSSRAQDERTYPPSPIDPPSEPEPMYEDSWVGGAAASGVAASFGKLAAAAAPPTNAPVGNALEELVREMLRPLMKAWLDENLPAIVQARVDEEVERIARGETR